MLQSFGPGIWMNDGPVVDGMAGFHYPTRMAVIRLGADDLVIWSPTALDGALKAEVTALGPVRHIIAPNALHHMSLPDWHTAFPDALVHAMPGVAAKRPEVRFASDLTGTPHLAWGGEIDQVILPNSIADELVLFHRASGTVIFTDLLQNLAPDWFTGWRRIVARLDLMTGTEPQVPRKFRMALRPRAAVRPQVDQILDWPAQRVLMAHGTPVTTHARDFLRRAFGWLT
ncbi:DUF4336 domain-containing protein [Pseudooceanicola onchidii]|uniref:DUF4336 domain-containing protein n=1 Tax=Pseudooceanicola onchidii TaxID=2562279 RepID=UPI0010AAAA56|nr:DUF4336 domain-containing protein [Pseudooceanicola onchidii]